MAANTKFLVGGAIIIAALVWLGVAGFNESKSYYFTVDEFNTMRDDLDGKTLRLAGDVVSGSIDRSTPQLEFVIAGAKNSIRVRYTGDGFVPDTFKDGSKALVEGKLDADGVFNARQIEAKCASKYEIEYDDRISS